ncbi:MAG: cysteine desulfurase [Clostridia bacterium]|nr:cysteine desulfurase [Clostridia bacterium]
MNILDCRRDFPLLARYPEMAYLDSSATEQKPLPVLDAIETYYREHNANPLRGLYALSQMATEAYEDARETVRQFINAAGSEEIIFTRNATESLNLIAYSYGQRLGPGDEIIISVMEHHSNLIPWQQLALRSGAVIKWLDCDEDGQLSRENLASLLSSHTKIVAITHISNVLGTENDIRTFAKMAHDVGAIFVCDGAQSIPHIPVDVQALDVDFLAFSGHKMLGPMGIGVLYGKRDLLNSMPPFLFGGEMIEYVTRENATWAELPHKFEAGTVNAGDAVGLKAAIQYYKALGFDNIQKREQELGRLAYDALNAVPHLHILGARNADAHHGIFSFVLDGVHPHDISEILSADNVCVRAGHHCAQVLMQHMRTPSTVRVSLAFYNTESEIQRLQESLLSVRRRMGYAE